MTGKRTNTAEVRQLTADPYGYRTSYIDDVDPIKNVIYMVCQYIGAEIVEECHHRFSFMDISTMAVIATSHIPIHTWPEYGYATVSMFSCQEGIPGEICRLLTESLKAEQVGTRLIERALNRVKENVHG